MQFSSSIRWRRWLPLILVAPAIVPTSGCIAAAVGTAALAGAGVGYAYVQGASPGDFPASVEQTWIASQKALDDLKMGIETARRDDDGAMIETKTGTGDRVTLTLEPRANPVPADGQWTHVTIRVATFGNDEVSDRILKQIGTRLGIPQPQKTAAVQPQPHPVPAPPPQVVTPAYIQTAPPPVASH